MSKARSAYLSRHKLTDEQYDLIEHLLPGKAGDAGETAKDNRQFVNGVIWIFKTGAPWRDLPSRYGDWKNVHRRFARWSQNGIFDKIFTALSSDADMEFLFILDDRHFSS